MDPHGAHGRNQGAAQTHADLRDVRGGARVGPDPHDPFPALVFGQSRRPWRVAGGRPRRGCGDSRPWNIRNDRLVQNQRLRSVRRPHPPDRGQSAQTAAGMVRRLHGGRRGLGRLARGQHPLARRVDRHTRPVQRVRRSGRDDRVSGLRRLEAGAHPLSDDRPAQAGVADHAARVQRIARSLHPGRNQSGRAPH